MLDPDVIERMLRPIEAAVTEKETVDPFVRVAVHILGSERAQTTRRQGFMHDVRDRVAPSVRLASVGVAVDYRVRLELLKVPSGCVLGCAQTVKG